MRLSQSALLAIVACAPNDDALQRFIMHKTQAPSSARHPSRWARLCVARHSIATRFARTVGAEGGCGYSHWVLEYSRTVGPPLCTVGGALGVGVGGRVDGTPVGITDGYLQQGLSLQRQGLSLQW